MSKIGRRFVSGITLICAVQAAYAARIAGPVELTTPTQTFGFGERTCIAVTPDGKSFLTGSKDGRIRVWDIDSGKVIATFGAYEYGDVKKIAVLPDSSRALASYGDYKYSVRLWDLNEQRCIRIDRFRDDTDGLAVSTDGELYACGGMGDVVTLRSVIDGNILRSVHVGDQLGNCFDFTFSRDGKRLITASSPAEDDEVGIFEIWDVNTGKKLRQFPNGGSFHLTPDGLSIVIGDRRISLKDGTEEKAYQLDNGYTTVCDFSSGGHYCLLAGTYYVPPPTETQITLYVHDEQAKKYIPLKEKIRSTYMTEAHFVPGRPLVLFARQTEDVELIDVPSGRALRQYPGHTEYVHSLALSPNGRTLLTGGRYIREWDIASGECLRKLDTGWGKAASRIICSTDGKLIAATVIDWGQGSEPDSVKIWSATNGTMVCRLEAGYKPKTAIFVDGARSVLTASPHPGGLILWQISSGKRLSSWFKYGIYDIWPLPNLPNVLLAGGRDLEIWDWRAGQSVQIRDGGQGVLDVFVSPDGNRIAAGSGRHSPIRVWAIDSGKLIAEFPHCTTEENTYNYSVGSVAFSPDGRYLLTGGGGYRGHPVTKLWDVEAGQLLYSFKGTLHSGTCLSFSQDGGSVFTGSEDGSVLRWQIGDFTEP